MSGCNVESFSGSVRYARTALQDPATLALRSIVNTLGCMPQYTAIAKADTNAKINTDDIRVCLPLPTAWASPRSSVFGTAGDELHDVRRDSPAAPATLHPRSRCTRHLRNESDLRHQPLVILKSAAAESSENRTGAFGAARERRCRHRSSFGLGQLTRLRHIVGILEHFGLFALHRQNPR
jgi:hypothetical protein